MIRKTLLTLIALVLTLCANAQIKDTTKVINPDIIYADTAIDLQPQFPNGRHALGRFLAAAIRYPVEAVEDKIQGKVLIGMVIEKDGSLTNIKVVQKANPYLDKEALRVITKSPNWIPAQKNGSIVRVYWTVPVNFTFAN